MLRADSAFYGHATIGTAIIAGADVSVTARMDPAVKAAIATIEHDAWTAIEYTDAIRDEATGEWISRAEVTEIPFTAFAAQKKDHHVPGRLVVRRIPDVNADKKKAAGQGTLFDVWRFHAFFTTVPADRLDTVTADKTHRHHAIIEQVHADLKGSALAHLPEVILSSRWAWASDLGVCVVDGVLDVSWRCCCSAGSDDSWGWFPGRVGAGAGDVSLAGLTECLGEGVAEFTVLGFEVA